jgi:MFS transporter, DHA2 family, multidrug resistance protein
VMGFGGGAFLVRTVILSALMFPGKARIQAVTWLYVELAFFQLLYPTAIGFIADHLHWNYAFLIDFPFLAIATVLIIKFVPRGYLFLRNENEYLDLWGAGLLVAGLSAMQVALSRGERDEWLASPLILSFLVVSVICFALFLWWDWRPENTSPVLHLRMLWRQLPLRLSLAAIAVVGALLGAGLYVLPQYLRHVQDFSTTQTGEFISGFTGGLMVGLLISLRYMLPRIGGWWVTCAGAAMLFATCVTFLYVWTPTTPTSLLWALIFLQGVSLAPMLVGVSNVATGQAQVADLNDVTTTFFFVRQLGNTFGVTAATVLFDRRMTLHSSRLIDTANALDPTLQSTLSAYSGLIARNGGAGANPQQGALQIFQSNVVVQSSLLSYIDVYFMLAVLSAAVIVLMTIARLRAEAVKSEHATMHIW